MRELWCVRRHDRSGRERDRKGAARRCLRWDCREVGLFWCRTHRSEFDPDEHYVGCGCRPPGCGACRTYLESGRNVFVVGERAVDRPISFDWLAEIRNRSPGEVLAWLSGRGAFHDGSARTRLLNTGLRWDVAINLLPPSLETRWSREDRAVAQGVAQHILPAFRNEDLVLVGRNVQEAFSLFDRVVPSVTEVAGVRCLLLPHPSGRNRCWNSQEVVGRCREVVAEFLLSPRAGGTP